MTINRKHAFKLLDQSELEDAEVSSTAFSNLVDPETVTAPAYPHQICANEYGLYSVPNAFLQREVPQLLAAGDVYEPATLKFMRNMAGDGDIVSGGAFIGDFFPALSRALSETALLHSFEPNPMTFEAARHTIRLNSLKNICLSLAAVGENASLLPLQIARAGNNALAAGARIVSEPQDGLTIDVNVIPIDMLVPVNRNVTILHLDVEGHEMQAMLGAIQLVKRCRPIIILEGNRASTRRMYKRFMRSHFPEIGYQYAGQIDQNMIFVAS